MRYLRQASAAGIEEASDRLTAIRAGFEAGDVDFVSSEPHGFQRWREHFQPCYQKKKWLTAAGLLSLIPRLL